MLQEHKQETYCNKNNDTVNIECNYFELQNRRYLGNKHKLLSFIEDVVENKCGEIKTFCDLFAGTGVVGHHFNSNKVEIISNDFLLSNYVCLQTFLGTREYLLDNTYQKLNYLNNLQDGSENYFSKTFGSTYFSKSNAYKIGKIRSEIDKISDTDEEKYILLCSLIYAADKVANTVGHYDAYRKKMDTLQPLQLLRPKIKQECNKNNVIYKMDANDLIKKIDCDILYLDPPYNSRQYSDTYHLLENLSEWKKPSVVGISKKMDRKHIKSQYCINEAASAFYELIESAQCGHILLSYNSTAEKKNGRSNARISDEEIMDTLSKKGEVSVFETKYKAFTTGKSYDENNKERIFYCKVRGA